MRLLESVPVPVSKLVWIVAGCTCPHRACVRLNPSGMRHAWWMRYWVACSSGLVSVIDFATQFANPEEAEHDAFYMAVKFPLLHGIRLMKTSPETDSRKRSRRRHYDSTRVFSLDTFVPDRDLSG